MFSNILKGSFAISYSEKTVTIDSNETIKKKLEELRAKQIVPEENEESEDMQGFVEGIDPVQVAQLVDDDEGVEARLFGEQQESGDMSILVDQVNEQAEQILEDARNQAEKIKADAYEEGKQEGYNAGYQEGEASAKQEYEELKEKTVSEYSDLEEQLKQEYDMRFEKLEPMLVDKLAEIYGHITSVNLEDSKDAVMFLLNKSLGNMDVSRGFVVHVSGDDFSNVKENIDALSKASGVLKENIEIIEDHSLEKNGCMIETEGGIFDVGLDTSLKLLAKQLKILSMN